MATMSPQNAKVYFKKDWLLWNKAVLSVTRIFNNCATLRYVDSARRIAKPKEPVSTNVHFYVCKLYAFDI